METFNFSRECVSVVSDVVSVASDVVSVVIGAGRTEPLKVLAASINFSHSTTDKTHS